jgi:RHS repeat-associated protein
MMRLLIICFLLFVASASANVHALGNSLPWSGSPKLKFSNDWETLSTARPSFDLDAQGRIIAITNAIDKVIFFTFDDAGDLATRLNAEDELTQYGYDSLNRLVAVTNEGIEVATFDRDPNGNILNHRAHGGTEVSFGYDEMNRLAASTQLCASVSSVVENSYDLNGNRTNIVYPGGLSVTYNYGADNRLEETILTGSTISTPLTFSFNYDTANRLDSIAYPNGVNSTFGHDAKSRVTSIRHGSFVNRTIERNALGFKETECIDAGIQPTVPSTFRSIKTHNDADQLISERVQQNTTNWTDVAYFYNDNGGLELITTEGSETQSFDYDYDNRLTSADDIEYLYDASGARIGRIAGDSPATITTNYFVVDYTDGLKRPLAETDASGNITRYYVWSGSQLLCHIEANGDTYYYHSDELGSTLALTDETGAVTDEFAYMPYGYATHTAHSGSADTPFQWLGGYGVYYDSDTDLHLTLHRAYSFSLKRFISPDPLGIDGGVNVYMWANMNPLFFVDPYGLCAEGFWDYFGNALNNTADAIGQSFGQMIFDAATGQWSGEQWDDIANLMWSTETPAHPEATPYIATSLGISSAAALTAGALGIGELTGVIDTAPQGNNVIRVISKPLKVGFRIDKAHKGHAGSSWIQRNLFHPHIWKW